MIDQGILLNAAGERRSIDEGVVRGAKQISNDVKDTVNDGINHVRDKVDEAKDRRDRAKGVYRENLSQEERWRMEQRKERNTRLSVAAAAGLTGYLYGKHRMKKKLNADATPSELVESSISEHMNHYDSVDENAAEDVTKKAVKAVLNQNKVEAAEEKRDAAKERINAAQDALSDRKSELTDAEREKLRAAHDYAVEDYAKAKAEVSKEKKTRDKRVLSAVATAAKAAKGISSAVKNESVTATANAENAAQNKAAKPVESAVKKLQTAVRGKDCIGQTCDSADRNMQQKTVTEGASMPSLVSNGAMIVDAKQKTVNDGTCEENLGEAALTAKYRNALKGDSFGLPAKRAYPLNDEKHVRSAISMFKHCPEEDRAELARNIFKVARKFKMDLSISPDSTIYNYAPDEFKKSSNVNEGTISEEFKQGYAEGRAAADKVIKKLEDKIDDLKDKKDKHEDDDDCDKPEDESVGSAVMGGIGSMSGAMAAHSYGKKNRAYREIRSDPRASASKIARAKAKAQKETEKYKNMTKKNAITNYNRLRGGLHV